MHNVGNFISEYFFSMSMFPLEIIHSGYIITANLPYDNVPTGHFPSTIISLFKSMKKYLPDFQETTK